MTKYPQQLIDIVRVLLDEPVTYAQADVLRLLRHYPVRCASRRGFTLVVGPHLVRLFEAGTAWRAERLPIPASIASDPEHRHSLLPLTMSDGWDVLVCVLCGSEW